ncbi:hypothetical protein M2347_001408 [Chryseobacterium sp. H1D6B]|nr:hypothetical protein [Chryseobacterium sp. H1D6B]
MEPKLILINPDSKQRIYINKSYITYIKEVGPRDSISFHVEIHLLDGSVHSIFKKYIEEVISMLEK